MKPTPSPEQHLPRDHRYAPILVVVTAGFALLAGTWLLGARPAAAQSGNAAVNIIDFGFDQERVTVPAGATLTWTNTGARPHTATDRGGTFDTQPINPGDTGSVTLSTPGTYFYFCRINPSKMNGVIVVTAGPAPAAVVRVQTIDPANIADETLRFDPPQLEVPAGTRLLVANVGGKPHSLTEENGAFNTDILQPGPENGRFAGSNTTIALDTPGTYNFFCEIHPQAMRGTIVVTGAAPPAATQPSAVVPPTSAEKPIGTAATSAAVSIVDFAFEQPQVSVVGGAEITFRNVGQAPHTATFDDVELDTGQLDTGGTATLVAPSAPGSYSYFCGIHTRMRGVLVVLGDGIADPSRPPASSTVSAVDSTTTSSAASASDSTAAAAEVAAAQSSGSSGLMTGWALITVAIGCLAAGVGATLLFTRRKT